MPCPDTRLEEARDVVRRALAAADNANAAGEEAVLRMAASEETLAALKKARAKFEEYALSHHRKGTPEGEAKAKTNQDMATLCDDAIAKATGGAS